MLAQKQKKEGKNMAREKANKRELMELLLSINGGKITDSDTGWQRTLNMSRRDFENRYGRKGNTNRSISQIVDGLL